MPALATATTLQLNWDWTESLDLGDIVDKGRVKVYLPVSDSAVANAVWQHRSTLAAGGVDVFDLTALPHQTLGVSGTIALTSVVHFFLRNLSTTAGDRLRVGTPADGTFNTYAAEVGRGSCVFLSSLDGWTPGIPLRIANISTHSITYDLALVGQGVTA